jgi:hypothetical protein
MIPWYQVFGWWILVAAVSGFKVYPVALVTAGTIVLGDLYIISRGGANLGVVGINLLTHIIPVLYMSKQFDPVHSVGLVVAYLISLQLQGTNVVRVYKDIIARETDNLQTRFSNVKNTATNITNAI